MWKTLLACRAYGALNRMAGERDGKLGEGVGGREARIQSLPSLKMVRDFQENG